MPKIKSFDGCCLRIYADDHNPPHFHLAAPDWQAKFAIKGCKFLVGNYNTKEAAEALMWAQSNEEFLLAKWTELNERDV